MSNDNTKPFTYQRYVIKIPSIYVRYTNKMTTNMLSVLYQCHRYAILCAFFKRWLSKLIPSSRRFKPMVTTYYLVKINRNIAEMLSVPTFICTFCRIHQNVLLGWISQCRKTLSQFDFKESCMLIATIEFCSLICYAYHIPRNYSVQYTKGIAKNIISFH